MTFVKGYTDNVMMHGRPVAVPAAVAPLFPTVIEDKF